MTAEPVTDLMFNISRLPTLGENPAAMIATPCDDLSAMMREVPGLKSGAMHVVLVEITGDGFVARDNCDRGAPAPSIRRALKDYIEVAYTRNRGIGGHCEWMINKYLPEFERVLDTVIAKVTNELDSDFVVIQLEQRLRQEREKGNVVRCLTVPHSEVAMHMRVAGYVMWGAERGSGAVQLIDFVGHNCGAPITRGEAGWPTNPGESPGVREALDGYALWLLEIVGKDRSEVEGNAGRRRTAAWLITDLMHAFPGIHAEAQRQYEDES